MYNCGLCEDPWEEDVACGFAASAFVAPLLLRWRPKPAATTPCDGVRATAALWHLLHVDATEECKELML